MDESLGVRKGESGYILVAAHCLFSDTAFRVWAGDGGFDST